MLVHSAEHGDDRFAFPFSQQLWVLGNNDRAAYDAMAFDHNDRFSIGGTFRRETQCRLDSHDRYAGLLRGFTSAITGTFRQYLGLEHCVEDGLMRRWFRIVPNSEQHSDGSGHSC